MLTIGQAAERAGVSVDTIRNWERRGFLHPQRTAGNQRRFDEKEVDELLATKAASAGRRKRRPGTTRRGSLPPLEDGADSSEAVLPWKSKVFEAEAEIDVRKAEYELEDLELARRKEKISRQREEERQQRERGSAERIKRLQQSGQRYAKIKSILAVALAGLDASQWEDMAIKELGRFVTKEQFPEFTTTGFGGEDYEAERRIHARIDKLFSDAQAKHNERQRKESEQRRKESEIPDLLYFARTFADEALNFVGLSQLESILKGEIDEGWTKDQVVRRADEIVDDWEARSLDHYFR